MSDRDNDEGLIDLSALAATPSQRPPPASVFPGPTETPPAAFARDAANSGVAAHAGGSGTSMKMIGIIAGGVFALILAGTGLAFAFRGEKPVAIAPSTPEPKAAAPAAAPIPPEAASAAPVAAASASDDDENNGDPIPKKGKGKGRASFSKGKAGFSGGAPAFTPPKPVKAADPCHCHGDFQCNIKCSAGK